jgi:hypothetical protein
MLENALSGLMSWDNQDNYPDTPLPESPRHDRTRHTVSKIGRRNLIG